jgi:hypothetical protein
MALEQHDVAARVSEKQASRDRDERALASGEVSVDELRRANGHFAFPDTELDLVNVKSLY